MRILVVEDFDPLRNAIVQGLQEAGMAVDSAATGTDGQWYSESNSYDVVVLDLMLPEIDGLSLLRRIREAKRAMRVLILTAKGHVDDRVECLNAGADDFLIKPFAFAELLARVRSLIRRKYDCLEPILKISDLEIDTSSCTVRRGERQIELTAREYALLEYLAYRSGELVTRTDIWEHVYDFGSRSHSNVVDVYIGYLRRKIEQDHSPKLIHTRRGQGYMLAANS